MRDARIARAQDLRARSLAAVPLVNLRSFENFSICRVDFCFLDLKNAFHFSRLSLENGL